MNKKAGAIEILVLVIILVIAIVALVYYFRSPTGAATAGVQCVATARCEMLGVPQDVQVTAQGATTEEAGNACLDKLIVKCRTTKLERIFVDCEPI